MRCNMKYGYIKENKIIYVGRIDGDNWYGRIEYDENDNPLTASQMIAKHELKPIITSPSFNGRFTDYDFIEQDGKIVLGGFTDETKQRQEAAELDQIRKRRETECFSIINRGELWFENLSEAQVLELRVWYTAWLNAPETKTIPPKPEWL